MRTLKWLIRNYPATRFYLVAVILLMIVSEVGWVIVPVCLGLLMLACILEVVAVRGEEDE